MEAPKWIKNIFRRNIHISYNAPLIGKLEIYTNGDSSKISDIVTTAIIEATHKANIEKKQKNENIYQ
jgi:hypothetical protein